MVQPFGKRVKTVVERPRFTGIGLGGGEPLIRIPASEKFDITKPITGGLGVPRASILINGSLNWKDPISSPMPTLRGLRPAIGEMVVCPRPRDPKTLIGILGIVIGGMVKGPRPTAALVMAKWNAGIGTGAI